MEKEIEQKFNAIIEIIESGVSLAKACKGVMSRSRFYEIIDASEKKADRYARACTARQEVLFEEIIEIADTSGNDIYEIDGVVKIDHENIQRDRLRVDARKWALAKMNPKKYGDKIDMTSDGEKINIPIFQIDPLNADNNSTKED